MQSAIGNRQSKIFLPVLILSGIIFFIPFLGSVHLFDWDEINFAESAREMIVTGNYHQVQINFHPFLEKPPFFFWLQVLSMKAFGVNEFAARFPNAVFGILSLITFYYIGKKHKNELFGFLWGLCYLGSFLPHMYFKSGIIDPVFNYFIFLGIYFMYRSIDRQSSMVNSQLKYVALAGLFIGLANLTKGPVGLLLFLLTFFVYFLFTKFKNFPSIKSILVFTLLFAAVSFLWFGQDMIKSGLAPLKEFLRIQSDLFLHPVAEHGEPFYYHFVVVFFGCFPISILALPVLFRKTETHNNGKRETHNNASLLLLQKILFCVVMGVFSITTTKIIHYSSMTYFPLSFIAAWYVYRLIEEKQKMKRYVTILLVILAVIFSAALTILPFVASHKEWLIPHLDDPFAVACFQTPVSWGGWEFMIGVLYLVAIITSIVLIARKASLKSFMLLFYSTAICLSLYLISVVQKIEGYSQAPAINFYKSLVGQDAYVTTYGFRSYAQFFYFQKQPDKKLQESRDKGQGAIDKGEDVGGKEEENRELNYLLTGPIDKSAYFVTKVTTTDLPVACPECRFIRQDGGFLFYKREAVK